MQLYVYIIVCVNSMIVSMFSSTFDFAKISMYVRTTTFLPCFWFPVIKPLTKMTLQTFYVDTYVSNATTWYLITK